ncbi:IS4 family transposase [Alicyclobacillus tolerans]|uniref:IS4 family transposase n=1 Tax=Alicyclobacillus tolerans TaxID=90970 RepID=UPI001F014106|nr:IS4 family transposase [Alicyclobacillus tolerans]MCF8568379.1 IS4 family transposase [Alicyclobacillus tolerans]
MGNLSRNQVLCQCLNLVPTDEIPYESLSSLDHGMKKLSTVSLIRTFVATQIKGWRSYREIEEGLRANRVLREHLDIAEGISGSQLSRRVNQLPPVLLQDLFVRIVSKLHNLTRNGQGVSKEIGRLNIVDSTSLSLPSALSPWAYASKNLTSVKIHTRLVVAEPQITFPDKVVPSTGKVSDVRGADELVVEDNATYVMDRGYVSYKRMDRWIEAGVDFVIRIQEKHQANILEERPIPEGSNILRDAEVRMGSAFIQMACPVRLVEFQDETGKKYRVLTTRRDLSAVEISEIYRHRWLIEIFFKWVKQHLRMVKLQSTKPQGVWNQIFLALIAYGITLLLKLMTKTKKTQWEMFILLRTYAERAWSTFWKALRRPPSRTSRGRQKVDEQSTRSSRQGAICGVAIIR